jgi:hypothetical protein
MPRQSLKDLLRDGDRRSLGRSNEAEKIVLRQPRRFGELIRFMWSDDPLISMRAADAAEKISAQKPILLKPFKAELLGLFFEAEQQELRWHLAQMIPRLPLLSRERQRVAEQFRHYLEDKSSIVKTCALQGLAELAENDAGLRPEVRQILEEAVQTGTAAMKARARMLLPALKD